MIADAPLQPGFANPPLDAQRAFRTLMEAWARPGSVARLSTQAPPRGLNAAAATIALTLCDADTPLWLSRSASASAQWLRFHCGCPILHLHAVAEAQLAFCELEALPSLATFNAGTAIAPETAATLVIMLPAEMKSATGPTLRGPGIAGHRRLLGFSLPPAVWSERAVLARRYPAGLDLVLTRGDEAVCIPRTTRVSLEGF